MNKIGYIDIFSRFSFEVAFSLASRAVIPVRVKSQSQEVYRTANYDTKFYMQQGVCFHKSLGAITRSAIRDRTYGINAINSTLS